MNHSAPDMLRHKRVRGLRRWIPGISLMVNYDRQRWWSDLAAGITLAAFLAPVGMGYAAAAGLPPISGLYASIAPLLVYAMVGPSRILVLGPDSALMALVAATVLPLSGGSVERAVELAAVLALLTGVLCGLAGFFRFGFITDLLSKPIRVGYMNGVALTLLVSQLPKVFGVASTGSSLIHELGSLAGTVVAGHVKPAAVVIGAGCLALILAGRHWSPRLPSVLVAVAGAACATWYFDLVAGSGISVIGSLPQGFPLLRIPQVGTDELLTLVGGATAIALVSITDMSVLSRIYALRGGYYVNENQELMALGFANIGCSLLQGFPVSSSASRTPVAESAGAKSQMTGIVAAGCLILLLVLAPGLLRNVPTAALGAVVIAACFSIAEVAELRRLYTLRRGEFALSMVCFIGVALLGVIQGIFVAVACALLAFIWRAWRPYCAVLGRIDGVKGYHDITRHPEARRIPGLVLFRWDAPLFFANAEMFREQVLKAAGTAPTPTNWIVIAAEPVTDIDITAADMLLELEQELSQAGVSLCFAQMKGPTKDHLKKYGLFARLGVENFFPTMGQAVDHYLLKHAVEWHDWDDERKQQGIGA